MSQLRGSAAVPLRRQIAGRKEARNFLIRFVKAGRILELGCGSGFIVEGLAKSRPESIIIGVDWSLDALNELADKNYKNVVPIKSDMAERIFPNQIFDTVIFVASLHEVYSATGAATIHSTLRTARNYLKDNGRMIIQDFLRPSHQRVDLIFKNKKTVNKFHRFVREFRPRKISYVKHDRSIKLDIADALEFMSKYRSPDEEDWQGEMNETHFFFTESDYRSLARKTGFKIMHLTGVLESESWLEEIKRDMDFNFEISYRWLQMVLKKDAKKNF